MRRRGYSIVKFMLVTLLATVVGSSTEAVAQTTKNYYSETVEIGVLENVGESVDSTELSDSTVKLKEGNHVRWIDRINVSPEMLDLYEKLEEGADNDGIDDILIKDEYIYDGACIEVMKITQGTEIAESKRNYILNCINAVMYAFDRDHPEVFWLSGEIHTGYKVVTSYGTETTYTYTFYLYLQNSGQNYDIRSENYRSETDIKSGIKLRDNYVDIVKNQLASEASDWETICFFNTWLTQANEYNTSSNLSEIDDSCRNCINALAGMTGESGPVCEGYARALKVLCDTMNIPCVLVDGKAYTSANDAGGAHMWNYVMVDGNWYGVDITWNDPVGGAIGSVSGYENCDYLLVGANTKIDGMRFIESHTVSNLVANDSVGFVNGPKLSNSGFVNVVQEPQLEGDYGVPLGNLELQDGYVQDIKENEIKGTWKVQDNFKDLCLEVNTQEYVEVVFTPEDTEWESIVISINPQINRKDITDENIYICVDNQSTMYDGMEKKPSVKITNDDNKWELKQDVDYLVSYENNINVTNEAKIVISALSNYKGEVEIIFTIEKGINPPDKPNNTVIAPYSTNLVRDVGLPNGWSWRESDKDISLVVGDSVVATAVYMGADNGSYINGSVEVAITKEACQHEGQTEVREAKEATCEEDGYTGDTYCKICEVKVLAGAKIEKLNTHTWDEGVVTKEATTTVKGEKTYSCSVCMTTKTEDIPALGGDTPGTGGGDTPGTGGGDTPGTGGGDTPGTGGGDTPGTGGGDTPGTGGGDTPGTGGGSTPSSDKTTTTQKGDSEVGTIHTSDDGMATYQITTSDVVNPTVTYIKATDSKASTVTIPDTITINGITYRVTAIEKNAFKKNTKIKSVVIGKNVKIIGKSAFESCKKLASVTIGKSVTEIGSKAFYGCSKLKTLTIKSAKLKLKKIGSKVFAKTPKTMTVKIPKKKWKTYKSMLIKRGVNKNVKFKKC